MPFSVVCDKCPEKDVKNFDGTIKKQKRVHDLSYKKYATLGWIAVLKDHPEGEVHSLGLVLGNGRRYDGIWAIPYSRQRKIGSDPLDDSDNAFTGNPTVKGFKSRRLAAEYLLRAEGFWDWGS